MKLRPASFAQATELNAAIAGLEIALRHARRADCPKFSRAIRRAMKSAQGARRHMDRRLYRARKAD